MPARGSIRSSVDARTKGGRVMASPRVLEWVDNLSTPEVLLFVAVALGVWLVTSASVERRIEHDQRHSWVLAAMLFLAPGRDHGALASAVDRVVDEDGPVFGGPDGAARTRALVVAIAFRESSFRLDALGDGGRSVCAMQVWGGPKALLVDADACVREGLRRLRSSVAQCPKHPVAIYAAGPGGCASPRAQRISFDRMHIAKTLLAKVTE